MDEASQPRHDIRIRIADLIDLADIVSIYNQAVPTHRSTANTSLYTVEARTAWFREHDPTTHPIFVAEVDGEVAGWCSLSAYRPGRAALRYTAEISIYLDERHHHRGIGTALIRHALSACPRLGIRSVVGVVIDQNTDSQKLLEKTGFQRWGHLPRVLDFDGEELGEYYYGLRVDQS